MNIKNSRHHFPILQQKYHPNPLTYFDNACMTLKPTCVIEAMKTYYTNYSACAGRSIHQMGAKTTLKVEEAREKTKQFIHAKETNEIIFTKNTTESINLLARTLHLKKNDIVLTTDKEHNSNFTPWLLQKQINKVDHQIVISNEDNTFNLETFENQMNKNVKLVAMAHTSNLDGYTIPAKEIIDIAHDYNALVLLDGAQSTPHEIIDVQKLDVDFFAFSFHKLLGPTGVAALYGKYHLLDELPPFIVGGNTVKTSSYDSFTLAQPPEKFEAGLQNYAGIIGAETALNFIEKIGHKNISDHITQLNTYLTDQLTNIPGTHIIGPQNPKLRKGILNFTINHIEPHAIALELDKHNIMVRSGVFCVHAWYNAHQLNGSTRASLYLYNTLSECQNFIDTLLTIQKHSRN